MVEPDIEALASMLHQSEKLFLLLQSSLDSLCEKTYQKISEFSVHVVFLQQRFVCYASDTFIIPKQLQFIALNKYDNFSEEYYYYWNDDLVLRLVITRAKDEDVFYASLEAVIVTQ